MLMPVNDKLKASENFDRKKVLEEVKEIFKAENFKVDEHSLNYKIIDDQLYIQGLAIENQEHKSIGFMSGR